MSKALVSPPWVDAMLTYFCLLAVLVVGLLPFPTALSAQIGKKSNICTKDNNYCNGPPELPPPPPPPKPKDEQTRRERELQQRFEQMRRDRELQQQFEQMRRDRELQQQFEQMRRDKEGQDRSNRVSLLVSAAKEAAKAPGCTGAGQCNFFVGKVGQLLGVPYFNGILTARDGRTANNVGLCELERTLGLWSRKLSMEVWELIFRMVAENPTWGAPRIHGELLMLGFDASERTISRWMKRAPRDPQLAQSPDRDAGSWPVSSGTHHEHCNSHESRDN